MKRLAALLLTIICLCATYSVCAAENSRTAKYIHFIPTEVIAESNKVKVVGYFVNLNDDVEVLNFKEFNMTVYYNEKVIAEGSFGKLPEFTIPALGMRKQTLKFNVRKNIKVGTYICGEDFRCDFSCKFSAW